MYTIYKTQLPVEESLLRQELTAWNAEVETHRQSVGVPSPFPKYEVLRYLKEGFVVLEDDEETPDEPQSLEEHKVFKRTLLNRERDTEEANGFTYMDKLLDSDERSVLRITTAALSAQLALSQGQPFELVWTAKDNSVLVLDALQTVTMPLYLALHGKALHEKCKTLKDQVDAATTIEEVEAISW